MTVLSGKPHIGLVVEGPGDKIAIPLLLRAYLQSKGISVDILGKPVPLNGKGSATKVGGVEGYVATAAREGCVGVVVVLDADKDASCQLGPELLERATGAVGVAVVIAIAEVDFEDWLYASIETLELGEEDWEHGKRGKTVITELLRPAAYAKPVWQPKLTARMDIGRARDRSVSLNRLLIKVDELAAAAVGAQTEASADTSRVVTSQPTLMDATE
jgi:hypothetical protein